MLHSHLDKVCTYISILDAYTKLQEASLLDCPHAVDTLHSIPYLFMYFAILVFTAVLALQTCYIMLSISICLKSSPLLT